MGFRIFHEQNRGQRFSAANAFQMAALRTGYHYLRVRWYLRFSLSYRDVEELLVERGLPADHTTIWRCVQRYAPELNKEMPVGIEPTNGSWRVDETYICQEWELAVSVSCR